MTATDGSIDTNAPVDTMRISLDATVARATTSASLGGNLDSGLSLAVDAVADDPATPEDETVAAVAVLIKKPQLQSMIHWEKLIHRQFALPELQTP
jgi:hypothetical protein